MRFMAIMLFALNQVSPQHSRSFVPLKRFTRSGCFGSVSTIAM